MKNESYTGPKYSVHDSAKHEAKGIPTNFYIRIDSGPYAGVEYTYSKVQNKGVDDDDQYHLTFDYVVLYSPPHLPRVVQRDFELVLWEILCVVLEQTAEAIAKQERDGVELELVDELDTTVPDEFHPEEFVAQKPESD